MTLKTTPWAVFKHLSWVSLAAMLGLSVFGVFAIYVLVQWWANKNADGGAVVVQRMSSTINEKHSLLATLWFNVANYAIKPWPWILVALASLITPLPGLTSTPTAGLGYGYAWAVNFGSGGTDPDFTWDGVNIRCVR